MAGVLRQGIFGPGEAGARGFSTPRKRRKRRILSCARGAWAHLGTTTGSRLCPKDQPQQVRMPRVAELSENAWPRRAAAAGAPHTAAVRSRAFGGGIKMRPPPAAKRVLDCLAPSPSFSFGLGF